MATRVDATMFPSNSTDALFRQWVQFIEDTLVSTGGWVVTGDTGQMTIASAAHPTVGNTKVGYRIYRMNDALQATAPVFLRIDFGGAATANNPGLWFTIGQGSDGAGNITSVRWNGASTAAPLSYSNGNSTTQVNNSYGCATTSRAAFALFVSATQSHQLNFFIERTRDADGTENGTGLIVYTIEPTQATGICRGRVVVLSGAAQPPVENGLFYTLSSANPSAFGSDVGIGIPIPIKGVAQPPGLNLVVVRSSDFTVESQFNVTVYGSAHNYVHLNSQNCCVSASGAASGDTTSRACMRYE